MQNTLENRLSKLIREIKEIEKQIILQKTSKPKIAKQKLIKWNALKEKVSAKWDNVSALDEISMQREKSW